MRSVVFSALALMALSACATAPMPESIPLPTGARPAPVPSGPSIFEAAPRATVRSELRVCSVNGSNLGPIGERYRSLFYTPYIETAAGELLRDPTDDVCLSSGFGFRSIASGGGSDHTGIDLANAEGGWIFAAGDGWVASENYRGGYGLVLEIDHGHGVHTLYAHLNEIDPALRPGEFVHGGQAVARMGRTGNATGIHLHYEVIVDGVKEDPLTYGGPYEGQMPVAVPPPGAVAQVTEVGQPSPEQNAIASTPEQPSAEQGGPPDVQLDPDDVTTPPDDQPVNPR